MSVKVTVFMCLYVGVRVRRKGNERREERMQWNTRHANYKVHPNQMQRHANSMQKSWRIVSFCRNTTWPQLVQKGPDTSTSQHKTAMIVARPDCVWIYPVLSFRQNQGCSENTSSPIDFNVIIQLGCDVVDCRWFLKKCSGPVAQSGSRVTFWSDATQSYAEVTSQLIGRSDQAELNNSVTMPMDWRTQGLTSKYAR